MTYNVFFENTTCFLIYVALDEDCLLDIILKSNDGLIIHDETIHGFNQKKNFKHWRSYKIETGKVGNMILSFIRRRSDNQKKGFWAIDKIQYCANDIGL